MAKRDANGRRLGKLTGYAYVQTYGGSWLKVPVYAGGRLSEFPYRLADARHERCARNAPLVRR